MRQILLLVLLFVIGQWLVKALRRVQPGQPGQAGRPGGQPRDAARGRARANTAGSAGALPEPMVRCAECGVHAPRGDSVVSAGRTFCSDEHAQRYASRVSDGGGRAAR